MAPSSVRDLIVKDDDLVVGTHGRGIWILDDITPLRQIDATTADAGRRAVQAGDGVARALEHEHRHAAAARRADGAESAGRRDHRLLPEGARRRAGHAGDPRAATASSCAATRATTRCSRPIPATSTLPLYWFRPPMTLGNAPGMHRFTWDVHYQPLDGGEPSSAGRTLPHRRRRRTTPCRRRRRRGRIPGSTP